VIAMGSNAGRIGALSLAVAAVDGQVELMKALASVLRDAFLQREIAYELRMIAGQLRLQLSEAERAASKAGESV
jgi:hypothetical protein